MAPRFSLLLKRTLESCGAHASGLGAESMGTANTRREKSLLMNLMTNARKQMSRNGKKKWEKEIVHLSLEMYSLSILWGLSYRGSCSKGVSPVEG